MAAAADNVAARRRFVPPSTLSTSPGRAAPTPARGDGVLYGATILLVLVLAVLHRRLLGPPVFPMDDAYITLHNAQVFWLGHDPNYVGASPLTGATSVIHLGLVVLIASLVAPLTAQYVAMWLAVLAYALGLVRLCRANNAPPALAALGTLAGLFIGQAPYQLTNGLETGLAMAAVAWALALACEGRTADNSRAQRWGLAALCGALPYVRPELAALSLLLLAVQAWRHLRRHRHQGSPAGNAVGAILADLGVAALGAAPWALWCLLSLGSLLPTTVEAKRFFFAEAGFAPGLKTQGVVEGLAGFGHDLGPLLLAALPLVLLVEGWAGLVFAGALLGAYWLYFPWSLTTYEYRYLYPLLPFLVLGAAAGLGSTRRPARIAAVLLLVLCFGQIVRARHENIGKYLYYRDVTTYELRPLVRWCREKLPPRSKVLIHDAGYISDTNLELIDLVGLKSPASIPFHRALTYPSNGQKRDEAIHQIALATRPNFLIVLRLWERDFGVAYGLWQRGWSVYAINQDFGWVVYALTPPAGPNGTLGSEVRPAPPPSGLPPYQPGDITLNPLTIPGSGQTEEERRRQGSFFSPAN